MLEDILCQVRNAAALIDFLFTEFMEKKNKISVFHIEFEV